MNRFLRLRRGVLVFAAIGMAFGLMPIGCTHYGAPGGPSFAAVSVPGANPDRIRLVVIEVFTQDGFEVKEGTRDTLVFQRQASRRHQIAYGDFSPGEVAERVAVKWGPGPGGTNELRCDVFMVRGSSDPRFEEPQRISRLRRAPYVALLESAKRKLEE